MKGFDFGKVLERIFQMTFLPGSQKVSIKTLVYLVEKITVMIMLRFIM